jgi:hypothetical protein
MINSHLKNFIRVIIKQGKPLIMSQEYYTFFVVILCLLESIFYLT